MKTKVLLLGYIPLIYPKGKIQPGSILDLKSAYEIQKKIDEISRQYQISGLLWVIKEDAKPHLVFILNKAKDVAKHLDYWSEGKPEEWFKLQYYNNDESYTIALTPLVDRIIRRHKLNNSIQVELGNSAPIPPNSEFTVLCVPLSIKVLLSERSSFHYEEFIKTISDKSEDEQIAKVSLIDKKHLSKAFGVISFNEELDEDKQNKMLASLEEFTYSLGQFKCEKAKLSSE